jgi:hypothetical protein
MDRKLSETQEIQRLIRLSEASRSCLDAEATALKHRLDVPARIRGSLAQHPTSWVFGSLASGLAASLMFRRKPAAAAGKKRRGIPGVLLGLTLTAARPLVRVWLADQANRWLTGASSGLSIPSFSKPESTSKPR